MSLSASNRPWIIRFRKVASAVVREDDSPALNLRWDEVTINLTNCQWDRARSAFPMRRVHPHHF